jgi:hypothetical protein
MNGEVLIDVKARQTSDGYLDVIVCTDLHTYGITHDSFNLAPERVPSTFASICPREFRHTRIIEVRSDGESLMILLDGQKLIDYDFSILEESGTRETVRFISQPTEFADALDHFHGADCFLVLSQASS